MSTLAGAKSVAEMVLEDARKDATTVDQTPFTQHGIGSTFGNTLALIAGLARCVVILANEVESLERVVNSRTEHLA